MAYYFFIDDIMLPVPPAKMQISIDNKNKTLNLINEGEINIIKTPGLSDISFDMLLPNNYYPSLLYGELMAYKNAELVADKEYKLTYLVRGAYGSEIKAHDAGTNWARVDNNVFKYKYGVDQMGKTVYIKFTSYNYNNSMPI